MPETLDGVVKIKTNDRGYYGFLHADGKTRDYYFTADRKRAEWLLSEA
ncbi:hypothetical protein GGD65_003938 [Bradyrhizobium sp. CIR18]|nr:hypothetical protein [Bradyrhizobium sp. CIR18]MBB4362905.1 hypothetical protein [Bradyrhizobium sp. CIR18]